MGAAMAQDQEWEEWAEGTYTYSIIWPQMFNPLESVERSGLKVYRSADPTWFRIADWGYDTGVDFCYTYDGDTFHFSLIYYGEYSAFFGERRPGLTHESTKFQGPVP